jgi:peptide/nickel transport system permease protein
MMNFWRLLNRVPQVRSGFIMLALVVAAALAAPLLAPFSPMHVDPGARLLPPLSPAAGATSTYILGTDSVGRDILSRLLYGARLSLTVGMLAVLLSTAFGTMVGALSGFFGGWIDDFSAWLIDVQLSFPFLLLAIFLLGALGGGTAAVVLILALGTWVNYARIVRAQVLSIKNQGYVEAARVTGAGAARVLIVHVLPNTLSPICVVASFSMAQAILTEAGLSFLGVGLDPSTPSWGTMLNDGRDYLLNAWWIAAMPGIAISFTVLAVTLLGEGLRDLLDSGGPR